MYARRWESKVATICASAGKERESVFIAVIITVAVAAERGSGVVGGGHHRINDKNSKKAHSEM